MVMTRPGWWRPEPLAAAPDDQNDPAGPDPGHREPGPVSGPRLKSRPDGTLIP